MRILHNISIWDDEERKNAFFEMGIDLSGASEIFRVYEDDDRWPKIQKLVESLTLNDRITTEFSKAEFASAKFLEMLPEWHCGYPEPSDDFGYMEKTYDASKSCNECNFGLIQHAPFRLKKTPVLGKKSIFQLNWIFDEYFVSFDAWESILKAFNINYGPVVLSKTKSKIENIVQLLIPNMLELNIPSNFNMEQCPKCGEIKYLPNFIGPAPAPKIETHLDIFKSQQHFGSGGSSFHLVIVSAELYNAIQMAGIKGVKFKPCGMTTP